MEIHEVFTGGLWWSLTWVGLTLIWIFHHLAQLPSQPCQAPLCLAETARLWNGQNDGYPIIGTDHQSHPVDINYQFLLNTLNEKYQIVVHAPSYLEYSTPSWPAPGPIDTAENSFSPCPCSDR